MRVHCDWGDSRGHRQIGVLLGNVFVQIPFPKHHFTRRTWTPHGHIRTGFWRSWLFPPSWLPSKFVRWCQGPVGFHLLDQLTIVCWLRRFVQDWVFAGNFLVFGAKMFFFQKIPYVVIFYCLGWLVGCLWFGATFRDVCKWHFFNSTSWFLIIVPLGNNTPWFSMLWYKIFKS